MTSRRCTTETQRRNGDVSPRDPLTNRIIGLAIGVHREHGPGLLESAYEECLCFELKQSGIVFGRQVPVPVVYKGIRLDCGYRLDLVVESNLIVEIKSIDQFLPIHDAQLLTYLRLSGRKVGLLMNFNTVVLKDGIHRLVLYLFVKESSFVSSVSLW
jgi:GxxExxY protein